jgi:hypothetical protein
MATPNFVLIVIANPIDHFAHCLIIVASKSVICHIDPNKVFGLIWAYTKPYFILDTYILCISTILICNWSVVGKW